MKVYNVVGEDKYSNGLVVFGLYVKDYNMLNKRFNTFITLREFIQKNTFPWLIKQLKEIAKFKQM